MDISKKINIEEIIEKSLGNLGDQTLPLVIIEDADVEKDLGFKSEYLTLSVNPKASFNLKVFNNAADEDHQFPSLHKGDLIKDDTIKNWNADFFSDHALLKYSFIGQLKIGTALSVKNIDLGLAVKEDLIFDSYLVHDHDIKLGEAVLNDLKNLKILIHPDQIRKLSENEAISFQRLGNLEFKASINLSEVLSGSLSNLTSLLPSGLINLNFSSGFELKFKVKLNGDFRLFIIKQDNNNSLVKIYKQNRKLSSFQAGLGIELNIENKEELNQIIEQLISRGESEIISKANSIKEKASDHLSKEEIELVQKAAGLLNIFLVTDDIVREYKEKYKELKDNILGKLNYVIENKLKGGIEYEYSKIKSSEAVFEAIFSDNAINDTFFQLISFKFEDLVNLNNKGITVRNYFKVDKEAISRSFGFGISLGNWKLLSKVKKESRESEIEKYDINLKRKVFSLSNYTASISRNVHHGIRTDNYYLALNANLNGFVEKPELITCDQLDYAFDIVWHNEERKINEQELVELLDLAICWEVINEKSLSSYQNELRSKVVDPGIKNLEISGYLKIPENEFDKIIPLIASATTQELAFSLAAAVPYHDIEGRRSIQERINNYIGWWNLFLSRDVHEGNINSITSNFLLTRGLDALSVFESTGNNPKSIGRLTNKELKPDILNFRSNFQNIKEAMDKKKYYKDVLEKGYKKIDELNIRNQFILRFLGRFLIDIVQRSDKGIRIEKSIKMEYSENGQDVVLLLN